MTRVGIVTGLAAEARLVARLADDDALNTPLIACAGPGRGSDAAEHLVASGVGGLVSFGLAGGLDPRLRPGELICPERVHSEAGDNTPTDASWCERVIVEARASGLAVSGGSVVGCDEPVAGADAKHDLAGKSGAVAVDMESHCVAAAATAHDLPFIVLRAVADPAGRSLPPVALASVSADGRISGPAVALGLLRSPAQIPAMFGLARDTRAAMGALGRAAGLGSLVLGLL